MSYFRVAALLAATLYALIVHAVEAFDTAPNAVMDAVSGAQYSKAADRHFR